LQAQGATAQVVAVRILRIGLERTIDPLHRLVVLANALVEQREPRPRPVAQQRRLVGHGEETIVRILPLLLPQQHGRLAEQARRCRVRRRWPAGRRRGP
jgi:hypothetical protein